jgi:hypothetical protein
MATSSRSKAITSMPLSIVSLMNVQRKYCGHRWRYSITMASLLLCTSAAAQSLGVKQVWTLRQDEINKAYTVKTCAQLRFSEGAEAAGELVSGTLRGIVEPMFGSNEFIALDSSPQVKRKPLLSSGASLEVTCTLSRGVTTNPINMVCQGGGTSVTFTADELGTATRISGTWIDGQRLQEGRFLMEQSKSACSVALMHLIDGVVVSQSDGSNKLDPKLRAKLKRRTTLGDLVRVLGPGYVSYMSSTGSVVWQFTDGKNIRTHHFPQKLSDPVNIGSEWRASSRY